MIVLGVCDNHESGAALVVDGELVGAVNEERINREKMSARFPYRSIEWLLSSNGLTPKQVDLVVVASTVTPTLIFRIFKDWHERIKKSASQFSYLLNIYFIYQSLAKLTVLPIKLEGILSRFVLKARFLKLGFRCPVITIDHHLAHAVSAYLPSGFEPCLIITADAMGDGVSLTVNIGKSGKIRRIFWQSGFCALSTYYSRATQFLGFTANKHEGKIVGLAAYGDPSKLINKFKRRLHFTGRGFNLINHFIPESEKFGFYGSLKGEAKEDVAAALQANLEEEFTKFLRYWIERTGLKQVALAGGIFSNVKLNQRLHDESGLEKIYVVPNMGDGGLCVGAALYAAGNSYKRSTSVYLGPSYDDEQIEKVLRSFKLRYEKPKNMACEIARRLANGQVVARFFGKMEFGPRALGNRSILYRADDEKVKDWLNAKLKRTEFMPFAPTTLVEFAKDCYADLEGAEPTWRYMNICFNCTEEMKRKSAGVVHIDGTARPQILSREDNPEYYEILSEYHKLTGSPSILNTSFNMHEEPIVNTPEDAVKAFLEANLDALAIGSFLVTRSDNTRNIDRLPQEGKISG